MEFFEIKQVEKFLIGFLGNKVFNNKKVDDFIITGKANVSRPTYKCCNKEIAKRMVEFAEIEEHHSVLEPSAGKGCILELLTKFKNHSYLEINEHFVDSLGEISRNFVGFDFLSHYGSYDRIVMNPPFAFNQYNAHIIHAHSLLKEGGVLVTLIPSVAFSLRETNKELIKLSESGEKIFAGNVCGENTSCEILKIKK